MEFSVINIKDKFNLFTDQWSPKIIAQMNDYHFRLARIEGEFIWHSHSETDEVFIVIEGKMRIELRTGFLELNEGDLSVIPKGIEHKPIANQECKIMVIEPAVTIPTGDSGEAPDVEVEWI